MKPYSNVANHCAGYDPLLEPHFDFVHWLERHDIAAIYFVRGYEDGLPFAIDLSLEGDSDWLAAIVQNSHRAGFGIWRPIRRSDVSFPVDIDTLAWRLVMDGSSSVKIWLRTTRDIGGIGAAQYHWSSFLQVARIEHLVLISPFEIGDLIEAITILPADVPDGEKDVPSAGPNHSIRIVNILCDTELVVVLLEELKSVETELDLKMVDLIRVYHDLHFFESA